MRQDSTKFKISRRHRDVKMHSSRPRPAYR